MLNSIFPESVNGGVGTVTLPTLMICLLVAVILGVLTSLVFSFKTKHSQSFSLTLALLPMAICIVIILVTVLMERSFISDETSQIALLKAIISSYIL